MRILFLFSLLFSFVLGGDFSAEIINYTKVGFNQQAINTKTGAYPTDSFSVLYGSLSYDKIFSNHLVFGTGIALGGIVLDSTRNYGDLAYKYLGYSQGFLGTQKASPDNTQNYFIKNLYIGYQGDNFDFKIGRFVLRNSEWLTGYNSAIETDYHTGNWAFYALASIQKASYGGKWLKAFRTTNSTSSGNRAIPNYNPTVVLGVKFTPEHFFYHLFLQFQANRYFAPGFRFRYETNIPTNSLVIGSKTDLIGLLTLHTKSSSNYVSSYDMGGDPVFSTVSSSSPYLLGYKGRRAGWGGVSLGIKQTFSINSYHFGIQFYGNIGNPNTFIGGQGNPIGIDLNDNSIYERGTANNAILDANSLSSMLFAERKFKDLTVRFFGRVTTSQRVLEESFSLNASYYFTEQTSLGVNLTLYHTKVHAGYKIYNTYLLSDRSDDRSFLSTYFVHKF